MSSSSAGNYGLCAIGIADRKYTNGTRARPIPSRAFLSESRNTDAQPWSACDSITPRLFRVSLPFGSAPPQGGLRWRPRQ
ncbi:hypothetical protein T09_2413 [Trichinella sp. T9]|nr:hypothetical protein T09_2413 [Trichinella sp. T9]